MLDLLIYGAVLLSAAALSFVHWRVHRQNRKAHIRLQGKPFNYDFSSNLRTNIDNAEHIISIMKMAQQRKPDAVHYDEQQLMFELGYAYDYHLSVAANLAVMQSVLRALKG